MELGGTKMTCDRKECDDASELPHPRKLELVLSVESQIRERARATFVYLRRPKPALLITPPPSDQTPTA